MCEVEIKPLEVTQFLILNKFMKKTFYYLFVCLMCLFISACSSCNKKSQLNDVVKAELNVENTISLDKEYMFANYRDYSWFETCVLLENFLDLKVSFYNQDK